MLAIKKNLHEAGLAAALILIPSRPRGSDGGDSASSNNSGSPSAANVNANLKPDREIGGLSLFSNN